jgi:hypothetical protein
VKHDDDHEPVQAHDPRFNAPPQSRPAPRRGARGTEQSRTAARSRGPAGAAAERELRWRSGPTADARFQPAAYRDTPRDPRYLNPRGPVRPEEPRPVRPRTSERQSAAPAQLRVADGRPDLELRQKRPRRWWPVVTALLVLAIGASLLSGSGRRQWALSLIRQPTHYTVLSFTKAWALPTTAVRGRPLTITFSVGNQEGRAVDYRYVITESAGGVSRRLGKSSKILSAGASWTVTAVVRPTCATSPCKVEVSLPSYSEKIDFLVDLTAAQRAQRR